MVAISKSKKRVALLALFLTTLACGDEGSPVADGSESHATSTEDSNSGTSTEDTSADTNAASEATDDSSTGTDSETETETETSGEDSNDTGDPPEPAIHWVGRHAIEGEVHHFGWSGAGFVARFDGVGLSVTMDDDAGWWTVVVDDEVQVPLQTSPGEQDYVLAQDLAAGEHVVEFYRRTEGMFGVSSIASVDIDGELLAPPPVERRIEVIGDSITCGYGNEGPDEFCPFSAQTENNYLAYASVAARAVDAELHTIAWSGKGVIYNYGDDIQDPLPALYDRTLASQQQGSWDFSWQPDVVVINLGTNDFSTDNDPSEALFVDAYVEFLSHLRDVYPDAALMLVMPSVFGAEVDLVASYLDAVIAERNMQGDDNLVVVDLSTEQIGWGCDYHPSVATHALMAELLVTELEVLLGW